MSVKGERGESREKSIVSRAKESLVSEGDDMLLIISHIPGFPIVGGALRKLELMI
jgi:hypothetical protein